MNLMDLFIKIGVDDQATDKINKISTSLKKGLTAAAKVATTAITTGSAALIGLGKVGLDYNKQMETYTTNFEVMMGDAEAAAKKVEELKEMGAKTPFELGDLANATQTLLAFNVSADDSNSVLMKLGDISLGNEQKLESLTRAYGKMNASQKVTLEDINMMIDAGFNPLLIVADQTRQTMEEVYESISKGKISFDQITQAIDVATSSGGQFYQGMDKASQTTAGLVSTLQDVVNSKIGEFFGGISEKIKELLPNVISFIENIDVQDVTKKLEGLMQTFVNLLPVITGITAATLAYKAAVSIAGIIDALKKATESQTIAQGLLNAVMNANPFVLVATLIAGVTAALVVLWNTNETFRTVLIDTWTDIQETAAAVWGWIVSFFTEKIPQAWNSLSEWFADIPKKMAEVGKNIVSGLWEGIAAMGNWIKDKVSGFFGGIVDGAKGLLGIHSPSTVFAEIGSNMALGINKGWEDEFRAVKRDIETSMNFEAANINAGYSINRQNETLGGLLGILQNSMTQAQGGTYQINLTLEGQTLASVLFDPLQSVVRQRGEGLA